MFPDLGGTRTSKTGEATRQKRRASEAVSSDKGDGHTGRRKQMSPAARRAVSVRMKKYWAARRKAKAA
jgi:hypothetical protein